ncbi:Serine/threonine-protein phosphatase 2B catalytic subunit alpha, partial [Ascosphaera atra]
KRAIRNKILAIGRLSRVFQVLREESERVTEFKSATGQQLPQGTLMLGAEGIKAAITNFEDARRVDLENERLPPTQEEVVRKSEEERRSAIERATKEAENDTSLVSLGRRISVSRRSKGGGSPAAAAAAARSRAESGADKEKEEKGEKGEKTEKS